MTQLTWTGARLVWLPMAVLLGLLGVLAPGWRAVVLPFLLLTVLATAAIGGIGNVSWYSWLAHLIPAEKRGEFIAQRARWLSLASLVSLPIVGLVLDQARGLGQDALGFALVLGTCFLCGVVGWRFLSGVPAVVHVPVAPNVGKAHHHAGAISPGRLALYTVVWQVAVYLSAPFFGAYSLGRLGMSFSVLMNLQILSQVVPILTVGWWGGVVDRVGLRLPLGLCSLGKAVVPLCYLAASPTFWWPIVLANVLSVLDAGISVANGSAFAHMAGGAHGSARVAHLNVLISVAASVTPLLAGALVAQKSIGGFDLLAVLFVLSGLGRGASGIILLLPERAKPRRFRSRVAIPAPEVG
jgi:hypothetical protein